MTPETLTALIVGITALVTSVGVCVRKMHLRRFRAKLCCANVSVDMASSSTDDVEKSLPDVNVNEAHSAIDEGGVKKQAGDKHNHRASAQF